MHLPLSAAVADLIVLDSAASTNDELLTRGDGAPEFTVVATMNQTAGRGRLGREWVAPPGQTLAASLMLRPRLPAGEPLEITRWGWIPLLAGLAMARAVSEILPDRPARVKWPNDVLIRGRKVCGILIDLVPDGDALVLGVGLNLDIPADSLPTPTSTSLTVEGASGTAGELADAALSGFIGAFRPLYAEFLRLGGDEEGSGIRQSVIDACSTIGQEVRVVLPGRDDFVGTAIDIDAAGRLRVRRGSDGWVQAVAAGDVTHLRYE